MTNEVDALNRSRSFVYDDAGNLRQRQNADDAVTEYEYDELNRLRVVEYPDLSVVTNDYNELGLLKYQSNDVAEVWYSYDDINRLHLVTQKVGEVESVIEYKYDNNGNRTNVTFGGVSVAYAFNGEHLLASVEDWADRQTKYMYDDLNRMTNISYPNDVSSRWDWDDSSRLRRIRHAGTGGDFVDRVYNLDGHGNLRELEVNAGILPQVAPSLERLHQNAADELTVLQEKQDPGVSTWAEINPIYDDNGCLSSDGEVDYAYDYDERLISTLSSGSSVSYSYAGDGTRVMSELTQGGNTESVIYVIDYGDPLLRPLAELDENGVVIRRYVWGRGLVAQIESSGAIRYFHADNQGSTLALTDEGSVVTDEWFYSPYGKTMVRSGASMVPYQWVGGMGVRRENGDLYFMKARYYHFGHRRFITPDPIGILGGVNLYAYANANPLRFSDPDGLRAVLLSSWTQSGIQVGPANNWAEALGGLAQQAIEGAGVYDELDSAALGLAVTLGFVSSAQFPDPVWAPFLSGATDASSAYQQQLEWMYPSEINEVLESLPDTPVPY